MVVGEHAEALRWRDGEVWAVHDWDSLAWQPEAAAFLETYQELRGRGFSAEEQELAWAASLWTAMHNARSEALHGDAPVSGEAVRVQAAERLRRANA